MYIYVLHMHIPNAGAGNAAGANIAARRTRFGSLTLMYVPYDFSFATIGDVASRDQRNALNIIITR